VFRYLRGGWMKREITTLFVVLLVCSLSCAFNLTNSFRAMDPANGLNNNLFGQIRTARDPRILQFALKYVF